MIGAAVGQVVAGHRRNHHVLEAEPVGRLGNAFRLVVARPPTEKEAAVLAELVKKELGREKATPEAAWAAVARVLLNLDEAITKE